MEHPLLPISKNENGLKPKKVRFISASSIEQIGHLRDYTRGNHQVKINAYTNKTC